MKIVCLDLEGVLVPEMWIAFAEAAGIPELRRTTRDEPDYDKLMKFRIAILKEHGLGLSEIPNRAADWLMPFPTMDGTAMVAARMASSCCSAKTMSWPNFGNSL